MENEDSIFDNIRGSMLVEFIVCSVCGNLFLYFFSVIIVYY